MDDEKELLERRKAAFPQFYEELIPSLVDFVGRIGIQPAHEVLHHAPEYVGHLDSALRDLTIPEDEDRLWLLTRLGYFIGEYLAQKYAGSWYVSEMQASKYFARYVVGRFSKIDKANAVVDPFEVARAFCDAAPPRELTPLLVEVETELAATSA